MTVKVCLGLWIDALPSSHGTSTYYLVAKRPDTAAALLQHIGSNACLNQKLLCITARSLTKATELRAVAN